MSQSRFFRENRRGARMEGQFDMDPRLARAYLNLNKKGKWSGDEQRANKQSRAKHSAMLRPRTS